MSTGFGDPGQPPETSTGAVEPDETTTTTVRATIVTATFPEEPEGGLVILQGIPVANPETVTVVKKVVVQSSPSGSGSGSSPAPATQPSSGS